MTLARDAAAVVLAVLIALAAVYLITGGSHGQTILQCQGGMCTISQDELRMLVVRAKLCGWEQK